MSRVGYLSGTIMGNLSPPARLYFPQTLYKILSLSARFSNCHWKALALQVLMNHLLLTPSGPVARESPPFHSPLLTATQEPIPMKLPAQLSPSASENDVDRPWFKHVALSLPQLF